LGSETREAFTVLKLGGSVITEKERLMTPNLETIERLAQEIAQANIRQLIIVHGGGSFGHPLAKQYNLKGGLHSEFQIGGLSKTHQVMLELNKLVVDSLIQHNIRAFSVCPSSFIVTKNGRIQTPRYSAIQRLLKIGFTPVLFGDTVLDEITGFNILSGDQLVANLATVFKARRIIIGVDVNGLYKADPKTKSSAVFLPHITRREIKTIMHNIEEAKTPDVTGGMLGKIIEMMPAINADIPIVIVNAHTRGNMYKVLKGEDVVCTIIEKG